MRDYYNQFNWPGIDDFYVSDNKRSDKYLFEIEERRIYDLLRQATLKNKKVGMSIAVTGERGNGKTSFLRRISKSLHNDKKDMSSKLWVLPLVNPSYFSNHLNILEILIASIQNDLHLQKSKHESYAYATESIEMSIEAVGSVIAQMRVERWASVDTTSTQDYFEQSSNIMKLSDDITKLIQKYLEFVSGFSDTHVSRLVLIVDDLDLVDNDLIYRAWLDIQDILSRTPLVMILSYRETQLRQALDQQLIINNESLLKHHQIDMEEIRSRVTARIEKQVPDQHKIILKSAQAILQTKMAELVSPLYNVEQPTKQKLQATLNDILLGNQKLKDTEIDLSLVTADEWLNDFFEIRLGMRWTPVSGYEQVDQLKPMSLREFVDLFQLTVRVSEILDNNGHFGLALEIAREYYLNRAKKYLPQDLNEALLAFDNAQIPSKNMTIYSKLFNIEGIVRNSSKASVTIPDYLKHLVNNLIDDSALIRSLNSEPILQSPITLAKDVSIGDVFHIISLLEMQCERSTVLGIFFGTIKLLYSIVLQRELDTAISGTGDIKSYCDLVNGMLMPEEYSYFAKGLAGYEDAAVEELSVKYDLNEQGDFAELRYTKYAVSSNYGRYKLSGNNKHVRNNLSQILRYSNQPYFITNSSDQQYQPGSSYRIDFYAPLAKEKHILAYVNEAKQSPDIFASEYVLRDAFDIDYFMMQQYTKKSLLLDALSDIIAKVNSAIKSVQVRFIGGNYFIIQHGQLYNLQVNQPAPFMEENNSQDTGDNTVNCLQIEPEKLRKAIIKSSAKNPAVRAFERKLIKDSHANIMAAVDAKRELNQIRQNLNTDSITTDPRFKINYQGVLSDFVDGNRRQYNAKVRDAVEQLYLQLKDIPNDSGEVE